MAYLHTHLLPFPGDGFVIKLPEHGEGGDDEAGCDAHGDGASITGGALPSFAPSQADGMPGDPDDLDDHKDYLCKPKWDDEPICTD